VAVAKLGALAASGQPGLQRFQRSYLPLQPLQLPVDARKLRLCLPVLQIVGAMPFANL